MKNSFEEHEPSAEFRTRLKRDISRAIRSNELFGAPPSATKARRAVMILGVAAGVTITLLTGVVLGASASYASAAEPSAPRPTFAITPVSNALSAIGCGVTKVVVAPKPTQRAATTAVVPVATHDSTVPQQVVPSRPDRARIAALVREHVGAVTRGDSAADYVVLVLDANERFVWSAYGNGSLALDIAGDPRKPSERRAIAREYRQEYGLPVVTLDQTVFDFAFNARLDTSSMRYRRLVGDSLYVTLKDRRLVMLPDSARKFFVGATLDSLKGFRGRRVADSVSGSIVARGNASGVLTGGAGGGRGGRETVLSAEADTAGTYRISWVLARAGAPSYRAMGLDPAGPGDGRSGILGLPSLWISNGETYNFRANELGTYPLRVVVLHLTPGTVWTGR